MDKKYQWTVDVEKNFGGRTNGTSGIEIGLPKIIQAFNQAKVTGLFFVSTELEDSYPGLIASIRIQGHKVGSHGHFHTVFKEGFRRQANKDLSLKYFGKDVPFRAPKFSHITEDIYSNPKGHVSLLKQTWFGLKLPPDPIFYLHPFDIVETDEKAPNLFCKLWYSQPRFAYATFIDLLKCYS